MSGKKKITKDSILHLSSLAKLGLTENQLEKYSKEVGDMLDFVDQVSEVSIDEEFKTQTDLRSVTREDIPDESLSQKDSLSGRKDLSDDGFFTVKTVVKK